MDGYIHKVEELVMYSPVICKDVIRNGKGCSKECAVLLPSCVTTATLDSILDYLRFYHVKGRSQEGNQCTTGGSATMAQAGKAYEERCGCLSVTNETENGKFAGCEVGSDGWKFGPLLPGFKCSCWCSNKIQGAIFKVLVVEENVRPGELDNLILEDQMGWSAAASSCHSVGGGPTMEMLEGLDNDDSDSGSSDMCQQEYVQKECLAFDNTIIYQDTKTLCELVTAAISLELTPLADLILKELARRNNEKTSKDGKPENLPFINISYSHYQQMKKSFDRKDQEPKERLKNVEVVERTEDERSIDDLVQFINGKDSDEKGAKKNKKKKKNKRKKNKESMIPQTSEQNDNFGNGSEYTEHDFGEELDPNKMEIIDRDVEEFNRRLNLSWEERKSEIM
ncbi:hypothetical protein P8452_55296 [Trifolium repens]|nr:hypothetical protein P8452_55296 [Trifolium repens]